MGDLSVANSTILDLGCGLNKQPGALGVDLAGDQADQHFDLERFPWPLPESHYTVVYAIQVLEHLGDAVKTMEEIWRVCQHGALVVTSVPDGCCPGFAQDPTHKRPWNLGTFLYFCPSQWPKRWQPQAWQPNASFRILRYALQPQPGQTPWDTPLFADDLWVFLQAIKEPGA